MRPRGVIVGASLQVDKYTAPVISAVMSWNELYPKDTDLRVTPDAGSTGNRRNTEKTGYYHLYDRSQEAVEQPSRRSDAFRVSYFSSYCWSLAFILTQLITTINTISRDVKAESPDRR